jgi:hypothetical protein
MKKLLFAALIMVLTTGAVKAQNNFRGIVKYKLTSTGTVDVQIPEDQSTIEIKVYDNKLMSGQTQQIGMKVAQAIDLSQAIGYLAANGIELETYDGDGKLLVRGESTKEEMDSLYIEDKEPGHFYYERVEGTKDIFGFTAKKLIMHRYDETGNDNPAECWYTEEIGPEYCLIFGNTKGFPLIFTQQGSEGRAITYTCTEIIKGKVKEAELLLPAGYKDVNDEEFAQIMKEFQEAAELLE